MKNVLGKRTLIISLIWTVFLIISFFLSCDVYGASIAPTGRVTYKTQSDGSTTVTITSNIPIAAITG